MSTERTHFAHPQSVRAYGFLNGEPIVQAGTASGFLLGFDALDAHVDAVAERRPCEYLVIGEDRRDDGMVFPVLGMNPEYMAWQGYIEETTPKGRIKGWHLPKIKAADE